MGRGVQETTPRSETGVAVAAARGAVDILVYLMSKKKADVNAMGCDSLMLLILAAMAGHSTSVDFLITQVVQLCVDSPLASLARPRDACCLSPEANVSGARPSGRKSLDGAAKKAGYDSEEERATIAIKLLRHNLDHHEGEGRLCQNYNAGTLGSEADNEKALVVFNAGTLGSEADDEKALVVFNAGTLGSEADNEKALVIFNAGTLGNEADNEKALVMFNAGTLGSEVDNEKALVVFNAGTLGSEADDEKALAVFNAGTLGSEADNEKALVVFNAGTLGSEADNEKALVVFNAGILGNEADDKKALVVFNAGTLGSEANNEKALVAFNAGILGSEADDEEALVAKPTLYETSPPPNGGTRAWLQVVGMFFIFLNTAGITSSFGLYQTFYPESFGLKATQVSLIGSVQSFLILFSSLIGGPLYDSGLYRVLLIVGSLLSIGGTFLQSISTSFVQLFLTQGIMVGLGGGLSGFLGPSILSTYFTTKLPLASGIGTLSGGVAGIMYPILFRSLQPAIGYVWTVRVFGIIVAVTLGIVFLTLKQRQLPAAKRAFFDPTAFTDWPYLTFVAGNFMVNLGLYVPFSFASTFALQNKLADETLALYLLAILNVGSLFGRVIPPMLASRFSGPFNMNVSVTIMTSVLALALLACSNSLPALLVVLVLYGFSTGAYFALQPVTLISLCPDKSRIGSRVGMASAALAFGALPTSTVASIILPILGFNGVWLWVGATTGLGALLMASSRLQKTGTNLWVVI